MAATIGNAYSSNRTDLTTGSGSFEKGLYTHQAHLSEQQLKHNAMQSVFNTRKASRNMQGGFDYDSAAGSRFIKSVASTSRGEVWTLSQDNFNADEHDLSIEGAGHSIALAEWLHNNPQRNILIEGYTSITGHPYHDTKRAQTRVDALQAALLQHGIAAERIEVVAYGQDYPYTHNDTESGRALNERVTVVASRPGGKIPVSREAAGVRIIAASAGSSLRAMRIRSRNYASSFVQTPPLLLD